MNSNDKADAAWDDYVSQQQEEKIEELQRELNAANESFRKLNIHALDLAARIKRLEEDLSDAYAEMRKQRPVITAEFDSSVWTKAKEAKP